MDRGVYTAEGRKVKKDIGGGGEIKLEYALHRLGVQPMDERLDKGHLLACVLHNDGGVAGGTAQEVGRKHHRQVRGVHLRHTRHVRPSEQKEGVSKSNKKKKIF